MIKNISPFLVGLTLASAAPAAAQTDAPVPTPAETAAAAQPVGGSGTPGEGPAAAFASLVTEGGLTADQVATQAIETAPAMTRSRAALRAAEAQQDQALQPLLPRLDFSASYRRLSEVPRPTLGQGFTQAQIDAINVQISEVGDPEAQQVFDLFLQGFAATAGFQFPVFLNQFSFDATLTYPVSDLFLSLLPAYNARDDFADVERVRVHVEQANVGLSAREAYYNHVRALASLAVAEAAARGTEANRRQVEALVQAGVAPRVDLMRVEAQHSAALVAVARASGASQVSAQIVRTLMHVERANGPLPIGENLAERMPQVTETPEALLDQALTVRSEVRALETLIQGQDRVSFAQAGTRWPKLYIQGSLQMANPNQRIFPLTDEFNGTWALGAILSWSPNDTFTGQATMSTADAALEQSHADLLALRDAIRIEVDQAYEGYVSASAALEAAQLGVVASTEQYRVRQEELAAGTAIARDVVDAETDLAQARLRLVDSVIDVHIAYARLDRATNP